MYWLHKLGNLLKCILTFVHNCCASRTFYWVVGKVVTHFCVENRKMRPDFPDDPALGGGCCAVSLMQGRVCSMGRGG